MIETDEHGAPEDGRLQDLGHEFHFLVNSNSVEPAARILVDIEARAKKVISQAIARQLGVDITRARPGQQSNQGGNEHQQ